MRISPLVYIDALRYIREGIRVAHADYPHQLRQTFRSPLETISAIVYYKSARCLNFPDVVDSCIPTARLIVQQQPPHMVFQLFETESEEQFDDFLGKLLAMHNTPSYRRT